MNDKMRLAIILKRLPGQSKNMTFLDPNSLTHLPPQECIASQENMDDFARFQKSLLDQGKAINPRDILAFVKNWDLNTILCTAINLMHQGEDQKELYGYEPIHLLTTIKHFAHKPYSNDPNLAILMAIRLLQKDNLSECLRILFELQQSDQRYRTPYELAQKIFNYRQKGLGNVLLKEM